MLYEIALISVVIACGYWGVFFLRRQPAGTPTFGIMQLTAAALAGLGLLGRKYDANILGVLGAIGLGAGVCLLVVGPLVRAAARRFASAERLGIAARLLDIAEVLAPGSGVAEEKAVLGAMKEIRDGRIEETIDALTAAKARAPADARLAIDERIALLYLAAYRWSDAIAHAEANLFGAIASDDKDAAKPSEATADKPAADDSGVTVAPAPPATPSLRQALGIAPPVWVELLGAYGRTGDLDQAARMMSKLEDVCAGREDAAMWIHRARLMFLALAGRPEAVRVLVEPKRARHMSAAARTYWVAVAHHHRGDRAAATAAYEKARGRSRGRPRELIDQALANLNHTDLGGRSESGHLHLGPAQLSPITSDVVARVEAAPLPARIHVPRARGPWATRSTTAVLLGVAATITWLVGPTGDLGVLVRSGAMVRGPIEAGEWWRLVTCIFVHVGPVHLVVNAIGMFFVGRVTEELFGTARTWALFAVAGVAGSLASYLASPAAMSAGASGAIFGLLGAVFVELTLHRERYRAAWKRGLWGGLVVVTLAQLGVGFLYPQIDQWAHGAGLFAGAVFGFVLSPAVKWQRINVYLARAIALMFAAFAVTATVLVVRTSVADSLDRTPRVRHVVGEVAVTAPASWIVAGGLADPDGLVIVIAQRDGRADLAAQMAAWTVKSTTIANSHGFPSVEPAPERVVPLPEGWEGSEQLAAMKDELGSTQYYRLLVVGRAFGDTVVQLVVMVPDLMARAAPAFFTQLIASTGPA